MKRVGLALVTVALLLAGGAAYADYPTDCKGEGEPSGGVCGDLTYEGCCDDQGRAVWCDGEQVYCLDCAAIESPECGWMGQWYGCGTDGSEDPSGDNPKDCVLCDPPCEKGKKCDAGKCVACAAGECGGTCNDCPQGQVCLENLCCTPSCAGKVCGDDGCGGQCGTCDKGKVCDDKGACVDSPKCTVTGDIKCLDKLLGNTTDKTNVLDGYSCMDFDESGPEVGYKFVATVDDKIKAKLTPKLDTVDLDVMITEEFCAAELCLAGDTSEAVLEVVKDKTYYIVVDGWSGSQGEYTLELWCKSTCVPDCKDKLCGDDGCDGECNNCPEGQVCDLNDECCSPSCVGKMCGDDGCGGSCGECEGACSTDGLCHTGPGCEAAGTPTCGGCDCEECVCAMDEYCCGTAWDGLCVAECIDQCGGCFKPANCGDAKCKPEEFENCSSCAADCTCPEGEVCNLGTCCKPDCEGKLCGDDGCGGKCSNCPEGQVCDWNDECCTPDCEGKECGDDGCGGSCGECAEGVCGDDYKCFQATGCEVLGGPTCGGCPCEECVCGMDPYCCDTQWDDLCVGECENDCGGCGTALPNCGDGECKAEEGEDCKTCKKDCGCEAGKTCKNGECVVATGPVVEQCLGMDAPSSNDCQGVTYEGCCDAAGRLFFCDQNALFCLDCAAGGPQCGWQAEAGYYDCGTEGGEDPSGENPKDCAGGACVPDCTNKECGGDGCGNECGTCDAGEECDENGQCTGCVPDCAGKDCGPDGCGESCGTCITGTCENGKCSCTPDCTDKQCGDDGCNGQCGTCDTGMTCNNGKCEAIPTPDVTEDVPAGDAVDISAGDVAADTGTGGGGGGGCSTGPGGSSALLLFVALGLALFATRRFSFKAN